MRKINVEGVATYHGSGEIIGGACLPQDQILPIKCAFKLPESNYPRSGKLNVMGTLRQIHPYKNFGVFDFEKEKQLSGQHYLLNALAAKAVTETPPSFFNKIMEKAENYRRSYGQLLQETAPNQDSGEIAQAMVLGLREQQNSQLRHRHAQAGTAHLLAISGLHVGFALGFFFWLMKFVFSLLNLNPRWPAQKQAALATIFFLIFYVLFTGAAWSTIRAGLMAFMVFSALACGRTANGLNNLALAAILILVFEPSALFSPGFLLSFSAAGGLLCSRPILNWWPIHTNNPFWKFTKYFWQLFFVSIVATLFTAPLSNYFFQQTSLVGPFSGLLTIPPAALAVASGSLGALIWPIVPVAGTLCATVTGWLCYFIDHVAELAAALPFPQMTISLTLPLTIIYYCLLIAIQNWHHRFPRYLSYFCLLLFTSLAAYNHWQNIHEPPSIVMLDVGQGEAILIKTPGPRYVLIDGGGAPNPQSTFQVGERLTVPALKALGIKELAMVIATHAHPDHIGGLPAVFNNFSVREFIHNGSDNNALAAVCDLAATHGATIHEAPHGLVTLWQDGNNKLQSYHLQPEQLENLGENDRSLLLKFTANNRSVLFAGDNEKIAEELFLENLPAEFLKADFLQIGHHGSKTATSEEWLEAVSPGTALISCGYKNSFGLPDPEVLELLEKYGVKILRTDYSGAVKIELPQ